MIVARPATPGRWADTNTKLTVISATELKGLGFVGVARYVRLPDPKNSTASDIDPIELKMLIGVGLELLLVQHCRIPGNLGWRPVDHSGGVDAVAAVSHARLAGYPDGAHLYLDLEGINGTVAQTTSYCNDWSGRVEDEGYSAGLYVGYQVPLTAGELYALPHVSSYWSDAGPRAVATRGFALKQGLQHVLAGVQIDEDVMAPDLLGELPLVCTSYEPEDVA